MQTNTIKNRTYSLSFFKTLVLGLVLALGIVSCGGGGGGGTPTTPVNANPEGFFDAGTASVKMTDNTADLNFTDLRTMVSGTRFMALSESQVLLYDGTITNITGNTFTATVNIYKGGVLLTGAEGTATVSGTITTASTITGTLTGVGAGNGTFSVTYSLNNGASALTRVAKGWIDPINGGPNEPLATIISSTGTLSRQGAYLGSVIVFAGCDIDATNSTVFPIPSVNVYNVTANMTGCTNAAVNGAYTGFAATLTAADRELSIAFSNASFSGLSVMDFN